MFSSVLSPLSFYFPVHWYVSQFEISINLLFCHSSILFGYLILSMEESSIFMKLLLVCSLGVMDIQLFVVL